MALRVQSAHRWAVSGTPLDSLHDLCALFAFLNHSPFGNRYLFKSVLAPALDEALNTRKEAAKGLMEAVKALKAAIKEYKRVLPTREDLKPPLRAAEAAVGRVRALCQTLRLPGYERWASGWEATLSGYQPRFPGAPPPLPPHATRMSSYGVLVELASGKDAEAVVESADKEEKHVLASRLCMVRKFGARYSLVRALLQPLLWRNTPKCISGSGSLALPPVHQLLVSVCPTPGEKALLDELLRSQKALVLGLDREIRVSLGLKVRGVFGQALLPRMQQQLPFGGGGGGQGGRGAFAAAAGAQGSNPPVPPQSIADALHLVGTVRQALCHMAAGNGAFNALDMKGLSRMGASSLEEIMMGLLASARDKLEEEALHSLASLVRIADILTLLHRRIPVLVNVNGCATSTMGRKLVHLNPKWGNREELGKKATTAVQELREAFEAVEGSFGQAYALTMEGKGEDGGGLSMAVEEREEEEESEGEGVGEEKEVEEAGGEKEEEVVVEGEGGGVVAAPTPRRKPTALPFPSRKTPFGRSFWDHKRMQREWSGFRHALKTLESRIELINREPVKVDGEGEGEEEGAAAAPAAPAPAASHEDYWGDDGGDDDDERGLPHYTTLRFELRTGKRDRYKVIDACLDQPLPQSHLRQRLVDVSHLFLENCNVAMETAVERVKASSRPLSSLHSRLKFRLAVSSLTSRLKEFWRSLVQQHQPPPSHGGSSAAAASSGAGAGGVGELEAPDDLRCLICLDAPGETAVSITDCCHLFCTPCIQSWFEKNTSTSWNISAAGAGALGASTPCPSCKTNLTRDDIHTVHVGGGGKQQVGGEASITLLSTWIQQRKGLMALSSPQPTTTSSSSASASASSSSSASSPVSEGGTQDTPPSSPPSFDPTPSVRRLRLRGDSSVYGSRLTALLQRIKSLPSNDKLIVATSFSMLRAMVVNALEAEGIKATILGGSPGEMGEAVRVFQNSPPLTLRALVIGAVTDCAGLTLTSANHIFCLDPVVSPAVTAQLIGRIARQGQVKPCFVYHFAALDSLEERMICLRDKIASGDIPLAVQTKPLPLATAVVAAAAAAGSHARRSKASEEAARAAALAAVAELGDGNAALLEKIPPQRILYLLRGETAEEG